MKRSAIVHLTSDNQDCNNCLPAYPHKHQLAGRLFVSLFLLILTMISCQDGTYYHHSLTIPSHGWRMNHVCHFRDSLPAGIPDCVQLELTIRHGNNYPYENLWLYIRTMTSDSIIHNDSINWMLAKPDGKWLGKGWGSLYSLSIPLKDLTFSANDSSRWFSIDIRHGLRDSVLVGIEDIGLRIYSKK